MSAFLFWFDDVYRAVAAMPIANLLALGVALLIAGAIVGFLAGLFSFRVKSRWCPSCGRTTRGEVGRGPA